MSKPNKDGWIRHRGGKCPVDAGTLVEVRLRDGTEHTGDDAENGGYWIWHHSGSDGDIMAWRPHKPSILDEPCEPNEALKEVLELDHKITATSTITHLEAPSPLKWRDRIREIDATTIALNEERTSLVAKLKAEGFVLIQVAVDSAQKDIAQQDMSDPANWRVGDLVTVLVSDAGGYGGALKKGCEYVVTCVDLEDSRCPVEVSGLWFMGDEISQLKWHSRPPQ